MKRARQWMGAGRLTAVLHWSTGCMPSQKQTNGESPENNSPLRLNAAQRSAWPAERGPRKALKNISADSILKIWPWRLPAPKDARLPGNTFSSRTALTCARRPPRFFVAPQVRRKPPFGQQFLPADPHRERYVASFTRALQEALAILEPAEKERVRLYYAEEKTLAEIGRVLGEHESSVSRHLERVRRDLRRDVE